MGLRAFLVSVEHTALQDCMKLTKNTFTETVIVSGAQCKANTLNSHILLIIISKQKNSLIAILLQYIASFFPQKSSWTHRKYILAENYSFNLTYCFTLNSTDTDDTQERGSSKITS